MKKTFVIFGQKVQVQYSKNSIVDETGKHLSGFFNPQLRMIVIGPDTPEEMALTLLHELFHAVVYRTGAAQIVSREAEEILCEAFANFVYENFDFKKSKKSKKMTRSKK